MMVMSPSARPRCWPHQPQTPRHGQRSILGNVASIFFEIYRTQGPIELLDLVSELYHAHRNLTLTSNDSPVSRIRAIMYIGDVHLAKYQLNNSLDTLSQSIGCYRRALCQPSWDPEPSSAASRVRSEIEIRLALALYHRYEELGYIGDYTTGLILLEQLIACPARTGGESATLAWCWTVVCLSRSTSWSFTLTTLPATFEHPCALLSALVNTSRSSLPHSQYILSLIAEARLNWILTVKHRSRDAFQKGITAAQAALRLCSEDADVLRYQAQVELCKLHSVAHRIHWSDTRNGLVNHLDLVLATTTIMKTSRLAKSNRYVRWDSLSRWARALMFHAMQDENADEMDEAVETLREVARLCPQSHTSRPTVITSLTYALGEYHSRNGRVAILDELITLGKEEVVWMSQDVFLTLNIASACLTRAKLGHGQVVMDFIDQAMYLCQRCKSETAWSIKFSTEDRAMVAMLWLEATQLKSRLGGSPGPEYHINAGAILIGLETIPEPSSRSAFVVTLINGLLAQSRQQSDSRFLNVAMDMIDQELSTEYMADSIFGIDLLAAKADALVAQSDLLEEVSDSVLLDAWEVYRQATAHIRVAGRARKRFQVCLRWASQAADRGFLDIACDAFSHAVNLLPQMIFPAENISGRIEALREIGGLAGSSAAMAMSLARYGKAIEFLERTRGILWLQSAQTQDSHQLRHLPEGMHDEFRAISRTLSFADERTWPARRHAAQGLEALLGRIRAVPGFERFFLPPSLVDIERALRVHDGLLVVVVPSCSFCDVLMLGTHDGPTHLRLPQPDLDRIQHWANQLMEARTQVLRATQEDGSRGIRKVPSGLSSTPGDEVLSDMWFTLIRPIFHCMGLLEVPPRAKTLRRLWWCPIGSMGAMPLHAAGIYHGHTQEYAAQLHPPGRRSLRILVVAEAQSEGNTLIPNVMEEVSRVAALMPPGSVLDMPDARIGPVLGYIPDADILHFACHGHQDQDNPLRSGFDLADERLSLAMLMRVKALNAQLAYLSACESAGMDEGRPDEGLNLAGTMLFMGFRSVVATLWAMDDVDGPFMAEHIYKRIFKGGELDMAAVPYAIDEAVRELRESGAPASRWATYVHFGL